MKEVTGKDIPALRPCAKLLGRNEICSSSSDESQESCVVLIGLNALKDIKPGWQVIIS